MANIRCFGTGGHSRCYSFYNPFKGRKHTYAATYAVPPTALTSLDTTKWCTRSGSCCRSSCGFTRTHLQIISQLDNACVHVESLPRGSKRVCTFCCSCTCTCNSSALNMLSALSAAVAQTCTHVITPGSAKPMHFTCACLRSFRRWSKPSLSIHAASCAHGHQLSFALIVRQQSICRRACLKGLVGGRS